MRLHDQFSVLFLLDPLKEYKPINQWDPLAEALLGLDKWSWLHLFAKGHHSSSIQQ